MARNIIKKLLSAPEILVESPKIGQRELLLELRNIEYHYIIESNYKIIYSINEINKLIKIADVFDTRQNPIKMKRKK